jgi:predicted ATPase
MAKYDPLHALLRRSGQQALELGFDDIAGMVDGGLPPSAYDPTRRSWWSNTSDSHHVQAAAWLTAGYEVAGVDYDRRRVQFRRTGGKTAVRLTERREPFISRVRLKNYKSIARCDVRLGPLTVLIGPNGSGKSNFLDALAFLARAVETTPNQAIEERGGLNAILRTVPAPTDTFSVEVEVAVPWAEGPERWAHGKYGFEVARDDVKEKRPFHIQNETCSLEAPLRSLRFEVDQGLVQDFSGDMPLIDEIEPDQLYIQVAGARKDFGPLRRNLRNMRFYRLGLDELREPEPPSRSAFLGLHGRHLASVLGAIERENPDHKQRLDSYMRAIVPGVVGVDEWIAGPYVTIKLRTATGLGGREVFFDPKGMSDGTIRAVGVLAALFQPAVLDGRVPLVGIEEPEIALHPAAAGVLFDALTEASERVQVVATSQSPDLLDRDDLDVAAVRAVSMEQGLTTIGDVDAASRSIVRDKLYTLGELMRGNQISPNNAPNHHTGHPQAQP